jgi:hypothetical protein
MVRPGFPHGQSTGGLGSENLELLAHPIFTFRDLWKGFEEKLAIRLCQNSRIEEYHNSGIGGSAYQSTEALFQFDDRLRNLIVHERVTACRCNGFQPGLGQRSIRYGKWQFGDDDVREGFAANIDPLPEAVHAKQHGLLCLTELFQQPRCG